jgi:hypothetical protein
MPHAELRWFRARETGAIDSLRSVELDKEMLQ